MNTKMLSMTGGKYSDFKKEEYNIMLTRIEAINNTLTEKCNAISLRPLGKHFSFNFEFIQIGGFLAKIDDFDKKQRKDPLKKWWMNQKASEMATVYLPAILDKLDEVALNLSKQEKSELLQNKFKKYVTFELLECALECKFSRPRAAQSSVFPNTSFQYARSRLRKKLENQYFNETELTLMTANHKKKKEEWVKMIKNKKSKCKQEYFREKTKKQKLKKKHKRMKQLMKQETNKSQPYLATKRISNSMSMSSSLTESFQSSAAASSDMPILDTINDIPPPPPPLHSRSKKSHSHSHSTRNINKIQMPMFSTQTNQAQLQMSSSGSHNYCERCTSLTIELNNLTKQFHQMKMDWGNTQQQLNQANHEIKCLKNITQDYKNKDGYKNINYKQKYEQAISELQSIKSQVFAAVSNSSSGNRSNKSIKRINVNDNNSNVLPIINGANSLSLSGRMRMGSQDMSWKSSEFSVNAISDKMSVSGNDSGNQFNFMNMNAGSTVPGMSEVYKHHLKHDSNSTDKMLQQLDCERKEDGLSTFNGSHINIPIDNINTINMIPNNSGNSGDSMMASGPVFCSEAESVLFPIYNNNNNNNNNNKSRASNDNSSQTTSQSMPSNGRSPMNTFNSNINRNNNNYNISDMVMNNNNNNNNSKGGHYRNQGHINNNMNQMYVDNNITMPKINDGLNVNSNVNKVSQVYVVNNNNNNNNGMVIVNGNNNEQIWNGNNNGNVSQFSTRQTNNNNNNNMNFNNINQFPPSINDQRQQFVYDNH